MPNKNNISHLNDNLRFLINCCKANPNEEDTQFIHSYLNNPHLDTNALIGLANQHGILPLVYKSIKHQSPITNHEIVSSFKQQYLNIAQRNMLMSAELIHIMKLLEENGIEALAFKGPTLAQMAYGDITLRQYGDLDIYVYKEDLVLIAEILSRNRYTLEADIKYFSNQPFLNTHSDSPFYNENANILIEIHWTLFRNRFSNKNNQEELWEEVQNIYINHYSIQTFNNENLLIYLCMHGSKHIWERIEWIVDIHQLVTTNNKIDWEKVFRKASKLNADIILKLGLLLAYDFFQTTLPPHIVSDIKNNKKIQSLKRQTISSLSRNQFSPTKNEYLSILNNFIFYYQLNTSLSSKILFIPRAIFSLTSKDIKFIYLSQPYHFIYYIIRPIRITYTLIFNTFSSFFKK